MAEWWVAKHTAHDLLADLLLTLCEDEELETVKWGLRLASRPAEAK